MPPLFIPKAPRNGVLDLPELINILGATQSIRLRREQAGRAATQEERAVTQEARQADIFQRQKSLFEETQTARGGAANVLRGLELGFLTPEQAATRVTEPRISQFQADPQVAAILEDVQTTGQRQAVQELQPEVSNIQSLLTAARATPNQFTTGVLSDAVNQALAQLPPGAPVPPALQAIAGEAAQIEQSRIATEQAATLQRPQKLSAVRDKLIVAQELFDEGLLPEGTNIEELRQRIISPPDPFAKLAETERLRGIRAEKTEERLRARELRLEARQLTREARAEKSRIRTEARKRAATAEDKFNLSRTEIVNLVEETKGLFDEGVEIENDVQLLNELRNITAVQNGEELRNFYLEETAKFLDRSTFNRFLEGISGFFGEGAVSKFRKITGEKFKVGEPPAFSGIQITPPPTITRPQTAIDAINESTIAGDITLTLKFLIKDRSFTAEEKRQIREAANSRLKALKGK